MSIKKLLAVAGLTVAAVSVSSLADLEVTPYGAAQYRLRFQHNSMMPDNGDGYGTFDYSNRLCWRMGTKAKWDDVLSLQFQIGNDWGAAENVNWNSNNGPRNRVLSGVSLTRNGDDITGASLSGFQNLYAHLAYARWNPGFMFIEAGIIPLSDNGTLGLLESSLGLGNYSSAGWNGWGDMNSSVIGIKVGAPLVKDGVKVGVELTQAIVDNRTQAFEADAAGNPAGIMMDLQVPVDAGAVKVTPEFTMVLNRNYNRHRTVEAGDHEMIFGAAGSFKANDQLSFSVNGGYGMVSNENSQAGGYGSTTRSANTAEVSNFSHYSSQGYLVGAGVTYKKLGPGDLQFAFNFNGSDNAEADNADYSQLYTDLRYVLKLHKNFSFTPRYRTYTYMYANDDMRMDNRFELIFEGSF